MVEDEFDAPDRPGLVGGTRAQIIDKGRTPRRTAARRTDVPISQVALSVRELGKGEPGTAARGRTKAYWVVSSTLRVAIFWYILRAPAVSPAASRA